MAMAMRMAAVRATTSEDTTDTARLSPCRSLIAAGTPTTIPLADRHAVRHSLS